MGELTAALAHELNQPLAAILSNVQAAQRFLNHEDPDIDEVREILQDIEADDKKQAVLSCRQNWQREATILPLFSSPAMAMFLAPLGC